MYAFAAGCTVPFKYKDNVNYASVPGVLKCVHTWSCIGVYPRVLYRYARFPEGGIASGNTSKDKGEYLLLVFFDLEAVY